MSPWWRLDTYLLSDVSRRSRLMATNFAIQLLCADQRYMPQEVQSRISLLEISDGMPSDGGDIRRPQSPLP